MALSRTFQKNKKGNQHLNHTDPQDLSAGALDTVMFCQETLLVQFLLLTCANKQVAVMPISYRLCSKHRAGTQHCSPEAKDSAWEKGISTKPYTQNCSKKNHWESFWLRSPKTESPAPHQLSVMHCLQYFYSIHLSQQFSVPSLFLLCLQHTCRTEGSYFPLQ